MVERIPDQVPKYLTLGPSSAPDVLSQHPLSLKREISTISSPAYFTRAMDMGKHIGAASLSLQTHELIYSHLRPRDEEIPPHFLGEETEAQRS